MGCDIYFHTEVKVKEGEWHHYSNPNIERRYAFFALLAGVRNSEGIKPIRPRDDTFPEDAALITEMDYYRCKAYAHSLRVFNQKDIEVFYNRLREVYSKEFAWPEQVVGYLFSNHWYGLPNEYFEDARWIFWFAN